MGLCLSVGIVLWVRSLHYGRLCEVYEGMAETGGNMIRKIDEMHRRFGVLQDKRCEDCSNLIKGRYHDMLLRKCLVYGATHSEASDWRKK